MKDGKLKILFIGCLFFLITSILSVSLITYQYFKYKNSVNNYVYSIINILEEKYKGITEKEIMDLVNSKYTTDPDINFRKYGINKNDSILYDVKNTYYINIFLTLILAFLITAIFFTYFIINYLKREKIIKELTNYMKEINQKNYELKICENEEGYASILQNEIYKTTIMLREESENLKQEKSSLKDSISDISHQLKTPLTSILIMLDNILDNPNMDLKKREEFLKNSITKLENINFLIVSLLKVSRFDAGVVEFKKDFINVYDLLEKVIKNVDVLKNEKDLTINVDCEKKLFFIGDFYWELEALTNILKNAIEHSFSKKSIDIQVSDNPIYTKISIIDYGKGIKKKDLKNIFKRFYKGEESSKDSIGIGLNLAKKIIEHDRGIIKVTSIENKKTTFEIKYMKNMSN